tara:strand:+ start:4161 stop:4427 length:267 start_codon:yes stop_codon:yes gene_type:complete
MTNLSIFRISGKILAIFMSRLGLMWLFIANKKWPCYFFKSDTTGEKAFEEFFTDNEDLDMKRLETVGVIRNQPEFVNKETGKYLDQRI